jgi:hypothetical protein
MSLGRDEEKVEGSRLITVGPDSLRRARNGVRPDAHARTDALIVALAIENFCQTRGVEAQFRFHYPLSLNPSLVINQFLCMLWVQWWV